MKYYSSGFNKDLLRINSHTGSKSATPRDCIFVCTVHITKDIRKKLAYNASFLFSHTNSVGTGVIPRGSFIWGVAGLL